MGILLKTNESPLESLGISLRRNSGKPRCTKKFFERLSNRNMPSEKGYEGFLFKDKDMLFFLTKLPAILPKMAKLGTVNTKVSYSFFRRPVQAAEFPARTQASASEGKRAQANE